VVSVLATGPKGCGFEPGQGDRFLRVIKIHSTPSFGWEVKLEIPCHKILWHVKELLKSHGDVETKCSFPSPTCSRDVSDGKKPASTGAATEMSLLTGPPDSTGGCQSTLLDKLGASPSQYHYSWSTLQITHVLTKGP
jgi:hypothetical protein